MCKMVQSNHWAIQLVLLCQLWQLGTPCFGRTEHSSVGVYQKVQFISEEDVGDIVLFGLFVLFGKIGEKLDKGYRCPTYCEADHKHIYWEIEVSHVDTLEFTKKVLAYNP